MCKVSRRFLIPPLSHQMPLFDNASNSKIIDSILHDIQGNQYNINIQSINLDALNHASGQFPNVEEYEAVLGALFDRLKNIVLEINGQRSQAPLTTTGVENVNRFETSSCAQSKDADCSRLE